MTPGPHDFPRGILGAKALRTFKLPALTHSIVSHCIAALLFIALALAAVQTAEACPFCAAVSPSLSDRLNVAHFAIVAKLAGEPDPANRYVREIKFTPTRFLKGSSGDLGDQVVMAPIPQEPVAAQQYFTMGAPEADIAGGERLVWSLPIAISDDAADYIATLSTSPVCDVPLVAYFIPFLNHPDPLIARDAYDEFGAAPYDDVKAVADQLPREDLKRWVADETILPDSRRLFFTLLGVCGQETDADELVPMIKRSVATPGADATLDAMIACYLTLKGESGLATIDSLILANATASLGDLQSTVLALRFHGEEETKIERSALQQSMRLVLDRPKAADLVIRDLARWQDWSVLNRLVQLFEDAGDENSFLRVPIVKYLQACPTPEAEAALAKIEREYPDVVTRANVLPFELGQRRDKQASQQPEVPQDPSTDTTDGDQPTEATGNDPVKGESSPSDSDDTESSNVDTDNSQQPDDVPPVELDSSQAPSAGQLPPPQPPGFFTNLNVGLIFAGVGLLAAGAIFLILWHG